MPSLRTTAAAGLLALLVTAPSGAGYYDANPATDLAIAADELEALDRLVDQVPDYRLRRAMDTRLANVEMALHRARYELEYGSGRVTLPGHGRRPGEGVRQTRPEPALGYADARTIIEREHFDPDRLEAIQSIARKGRFTTDEAARLVGMLTFDNYKQDALIALYPAVTDPYRYLLALDVLDFPSSRQHVREALDL